MSQQEIKVQASVTDQIDALRRMTVADLKVRWRELYGEDTRSCNRIYLWRRLAWRVQELAYGGISERAKTRIEELNRDGDLRMLPPRRWQPAVAGIGPQAADESSPPLSDRRL